jgi:hypothetical protein
MGPFHTTVFAFRIVSAKSWQLGPGYWMWSAGLQFVF